MNKKIIGIFVCILFFGTSVIPSTSGNIEEKLTVFITRDIIYVPDNYSTIQLAVDNANNGDTIIVRDGTYDENIDINKELIIQSENGPSSTIVQAVDSNDDVFEIHTDNVTIQGFTIQGATASIEDAGIYLYEGDGCRFTENICQDNHIGIALWTSSYNRIDNNTCSDNEHFGIALGYSSSYNIIENNNCFGTWLSDLGQGIILGSWSHHNTLRKNNCSNNNYGGIAFSQAPDNTVANNTFNDNFRGIHITADSDDNLIENNIVFDNSDNGINIDGSENNIIKGNLVKSNLRGIYLTDWSKNNIIIKNIITLSTAQGVGVNHHSVNNIFTKNTIQNNTYGATTSGKDAYDNIYYLNNFINNIDNAYTEDQYNNIWNSTKEVNYIYYSKNFLGKMGNYWDDYIGNDNDSNGIGDTPYNPLLPSTVDKDYFPLMEPFENYFKSGDSQLITRIKIIEIAEVYANHEWNPSEDNAFHGYCNDCNKQVDTPDSDYYSPGWKEGETNIGVPYQWGGFSSLSGLDLFPEEDFDEQYTGTGEYTGTIHYAGDIDYSEYWECKHACGVDCSGFVSRCWNLSNKYSTNTLPYVSYQINYSSLKPGDVLNKQGVHVILFKEFVNDEKTIIRTIESGISKAKVFENDYNVEVSEDGKNVTLNGGITYKLYSYVYISNSSPYKPSIEGPTSGKPNVEYTFTLKALDIDGDAVMYNVDWGDGDTDWTEYGDSDVEVTLKHTWTSQGTFTIKAQAVDFHGAESDWTEFPITIPRNKAINRPILNWLQCHPNLFPILQKLLQQMGFGLH